jgi:hypothetical protein
MSADGMPTEARNINAGEIFSRIFPKFLDQSGVGFHGTGSVGNAAGRSTWAPAQVARLLAA